MTGRVIPTFPSKDIWEWMRTHWSLLVEDQDKGFTPKEVERHLVRRACQYPLVYDLPPNNTTARSTSEQIHSHIFGTYHYALCRDDKRGYERAYETFRVTTTVTGSFETSLGIGTLVTSMSTVMGDILRAQGIPLRMNVSPLLMIRVDYSRSTYRFQFFGSETRLDIPHGDVEKRQQVIDMLRSVPL